jgi:hypothetical protein
MYITMSVPNNKLKQTAVAFISHTKIWLQRSYHTEKELKILFLEYWALSLYLRNSIVQYFTFLVIVLE